MQQYKSMAELVKVKGLKGKQNKKKWAKNIDVSALLEQKALQHDEEIRLKYQQPLTIEDQSLKVRTPLDPNRFKSKGELLPKPKYNNRIVKQSIFDDGIDDQWKENQQKQAKIYRKTEVPAIIAPESGHSYHPHEKAVQEIIERVIDYEGPKVKTRKIKKVKPERIVIPRARNKNRRAEQLEIRRRKQQKARKHQLNTLKQIRKNIEALDQISQQKSKTKQIKKEIRTHEARSGRVRYGPKIGKTVYKYKEFVPNPSQLNKKLSKVASTEELLKERYDSIFRRGILEARTIKVHANKKKNVKLIQRFNE